jgi:hypothetical protein
MHFVRRIECYVEGSSRSVSMYYSLIEKDYETEEEGRD